MQELDDPRKAMGGPGTLTLYLSLYLLVLAFFILLNSMASVENVKAKAVLESLTTTFTGTGPGGRDDPFVANFGDLQAAREFQTQVARVFQTAIPAARVEVIRPGRLMQVDFPVDALFLPDGAELRPSQTALLDRIVAAMSAAPPGLLYEVEFSIGSVAPAADVLPIGETPQVARVGAFAREIIKRGARPAAILVGTALGDPGRATMLFRIVAADEVRTRVWQKP
jgi:hypothetical protein